MNLIELFKYLPTMRIEVLDYKVNKVGGKKCDLKISFSFTTNSGIVKNSAAEIDMMMLSYFVGRVPAITTSFLYFSALIYAIDRSISREEHSIDGWSRELDVVIKIPCHEVYDAHRMRITAMLSYLTGDYWTLSFQEAPSFSLIKYKKCDYFDDIAQVNLFSGGLDSLIGAIDFMTQYPKKKLFLASHYDSDMSGPRNDQEKLLHCFASKYSGQYVVFSKRNSIRIGSKISAETSCRSRSIMFIAIALQIAEYNKSKIIIPENGSVSLNYPLSPSRRSSCSTRTTHPVVLNQVNKIFEDFGFTAQVENPYELMTKGEMVRDCKDLPYLLNILSDSNSCGKRTRRQFFYDNRHATHCGHCMPCMYREASLVGYEDKTLYGNELDSLFKQKQLQLTDDFFAMLNFLKTDLTEDDIKKELRIAKVNTLPHFEKYVDLVVRTRTELISLISSKGSNELKRYIGII